MNPEMVHLFDINFALNAKRHKRFMNLMGEQRLRAFQAALEDALLWKRRKQHLPHGRRVLLQWLPAVGLWLHLPHRELSPELPGALL